jgi:hypothetical protein
VNPFEFRKIIQVGYRFDQPDSPPLLAANGLPSTPVEVEYTASIVFWVPARPPFQRCEGKSVVFDARPFELAALRDGAIVEHAQDFTFPKQPSDAEMRFRLKAVWDALVVDSLGVLPNGAPEDHKTKPSIQFTAVNQE